MTGQTLYDILDELKSFSENNKLKMIEVVKNYHLDFKDLPDIWAKDRDVVLAFLEKSSQIIKLSEAFSDDKEIVMVLVKRNLYALGAASDRLRNDDEVVMASIKHNVGSFFSASESLKRDKVRVQKFLDFNGEVLEFVSSEIQNDKEIVLKVVEKQGNMLHSASEQLQNDRDVVEMAMKSSCYYLFYASEELQNDKEFLIRLEAEYNKKNKQGIQKKWIDERMHVLSIYREEQWMRDNNPQAPSTPKPRKF